MIDLESIRRILRLLKNTDVTEFSYEKDGERIRLKRGRVGAHGGSPPEETERAPAAPGKEAAAAPPEAETHGLFTLTSPIVGTFYRASSPEAPPFVDVGSEVKKGQVVCIVEAMKLMNEIESELDGAIVRVLVENGQPVEYGEPLFLISPR